MDGTAYLIGETYTKDSIGQRVPTPSKVEIFVHERSVSRSEFFAAGQSGLSSDLLLITQAVNYSGEKTIEYEGDMYAIYRTYRNPNSDEIELYLEHKGGVFKKESENSGEDED